MMQMKEEEEEKVFLPGPGLACRLSQRYRKRPKIQKEGSGNTIQGIELKKKNADQNYRIKPKHEYLLTLPLISSPLKGEKRPSLS